MTTSTTIPTASSHPTQPSKLTTRSKDQSSTNLYPTVEDRVSQSTEIWARDLRSLFEHAKDRFADVSWENESGENGDRDGLGGGGGGGGVDRIWGHKAVIYARAPKAFKDRYFISSTSRSFSRSPNSFTNSPIPHSSGLLPIPLPPLHRNTPSPSSFVSQRTFIQGGPNVNDNVNVTRHGGPGGGSSNGERNGHGIGNGNGNGNGIGLGMGLGLGLGRLGVGSSTSVGDCFVSDLTVTARAGDDGDDGVMRLTHGDTPELFRAQLEWLYTGEGFGDVVEWISAENENGSLLGGSVRDSLGRRGNLADRRDKLGQDMTYMWRSKLYADVRIHLTPQVDEDPTSDSSDSSTDSLSSTAIFTSHRFILTSRSPYFASVLLNHSFFRPVTADIHLPTPPFTPAALHFCLGYMYAGHLDFSNRTFDLVTAFQIHRAAAYLQLDTLINEVESRLVHDFCHGLEKCRCKKCPQRAARVWRFASAPDVGSIELARRARDYVVKFWGDSWGKDVAGADPFERDRLVSDVVSAITLKNVVSSFRSLDLIKSRINHELTSKGRARSEWVETVEEMTEKVATHSRGLLINQFSVIAEGAELWSLVAGNGFNGDVLDRVMQELVDGVGSSSGCVQGPKVYQALVSSILLKVDPETLQTALPARSRTRQLIEHSKNGVLAHIKRRWMQIRDAGGFSELENWSLKEISDEIEVPVEDIWMASPPKIVLSRRPLPRTTSRMTALSDAASLVSTRTRTSQASRSSTLRPTPSVTTPEPSTGLKRLRLSSSASTSSAASTSRATPPVPRTRTPLPAGPSSQPQARSPTAARQGTIVPVGSVRARVAAANRAASATSPSPGPSANPTPTPHSNTKVRPTMTGGPKPLLTRAQPNASENGRPPSLASVRTTRTAKSMATTANTVTKSGPTRAPISSTTPIKSPAGPSSTSTIKPPAPRPRTLSTATTASTRSRAVSTISKAPSVVSIPATTAAGPSTAKTSVPPVPKINPPKNTPSPKSSTPGRTAFPTKTSITPQTPAGLSTVTTNRLRNLSTATVASRSSTRPPISKESPAPTRSPSNSTDETEARTPSQSQTLDPAIILHPESSIHSQSSSIQLSPPSSKLGGIGPASVPIPTSRTKPPPPISMTRTVRKTSTTSSNASFSGLRPHPASAFDPPKERPRAKFPLDIAITDGSTPFTGHGVALHVGLPCIVSLSQKRARFKANIRYIGQMAEARGAWIGIEVEDLDRYGVKTLPSGSKEGIHYFHMSPPTDHDTDSSQRVDPIRQARRRKIDAITESLRRSPVKSTTATLGVGRAMGMGMRMERSASPFLQEFGGFKEPRALFVRPSEIVFVMGAE